MFKGLETGTLGAFLYHLDKERYSMVQFQVLLDKNL